MAGVYAGFWMILILLALGPLVNHTPVAALGGLLLLVAWDLVDRPVIASLWRASMADRLTFFITTVSCWVLSLDQAIYIGVSLSLFMVLRQARMVSVCETALDEEGELREYRIDQMEGVTCPTTRVIQLEGRLFFAAEGALRRLFAEPCEHQTIMVRMRRTQGMDATIASTLAEISEAMALRGVRLVLSGLPQETMAILRRSGAAARMGEENLFACTPKRLESMNQALSSIHTPHEGECVIDALLRCSN